MSIFSGTQQNGKQGKGATDRMFDRFSRDMGIDLGTANTLVYVRGRGVVVCEPSVVAIDSLSKRVLTVGEDQKQHLELTRDIAIRVNNRFGEVFVVPEPYIPPKNTGGRIMSLTDPTKKMAKSADANSSIALLDPPDVIAKKIKSAVTDSGREVRYDEVEKPAISNLMVIYSLCSGDSLDDIAARYGTSGYGKFKKDLADVVIQTLTPIQARYEELSEPGVIESILAAGAAKAEPIAQRTLSRLQDKMGIV
jgi:tryptophanyl-tRNA synthetase